MARVSVYEYSDYKQFIRDWIERSPSGGRGLRKALAEAVGCQTPFITHVLSGENHFSAEQAEACASWMGLAEKDAEFFVLLVLHQRASTKALQRLWSRQISRRRDQQAVLKKRIGVKETLSSEDQMHYYSSWMYAAVHMAVLNPACRTTEALERRLGLGRQHVMRAVEFLMSRGLIGQTKDGSYKVLKPVLHLERGSPLIGIHHGSWRTRAVESAKQDPFQGLHYTGVISLSQRDYEFVREKLAALLEDVAVKVKDSPDEKLACLCFDWFEV